MSKTAAVRTARALRLSPADLNRYRLAGANLESPAALVRWLAVRHFQKESDHAPPLAA